MARLEGRAAELVRAPIDRVWSFLTEVQNMGDLSPECYRCEWIDPPGTAGRRFRGHNRIGSFEWWTISGTIVWDPPRAFAWEASGHGGGEKLTRWVYEFEPLGAATRVTVTFEALKLSALLESATDAQLAERRQMLEDAIVETLRRADAALASAT